MRCVWFTESGSLQEFHLKSQPTASYYICTLARRCFDIISNAGFVSGGIIC